MNTKVMLIAAHPDDAEIAMGGTIAALISQGIDPVVVDLTNGEPTPYGTPEIRKIETAKSSEILGIKNRILLDLPNREIQDTVENRKKLANVIREYKPEILFIPYWDDAHPDHINAYALCTAARFYSKFAKSDLLHEAHYPGKVFNYFSLHTRIQFKPSFIFDISGFFKQKMLALSCYESQFAKNPKNLKVLKNIETENAYWGMQAGFDYGEAFICKENISIKDAQTLLQI